MDYLFFDIECANCYEDKGKICEFGYVLTDEKFHIIDEKEIIINPHSVFDRYVLKNMLAYNEKTYLENPSYTAKYDKIKELFQNSTVIGHSVERDAHYLNCESERYNLKYINYKFYDAKKIYSDLYEKNTGLKLKEISEYFNLEKSEHQHRAMDDAVYTMYITKAMCKDKNLSIDQLINSSKNCAGYTKNGKIHTVDSDRNDMIREYKDKIGVCCSANDLKKFIKSVEPECFIESVLNNKTVTFEYSFQKNNPTIMRILIQELKNRNCNFSHLVSDSDIYVNYISGEENQINGKLKQVEKGIKKGKDIEIISVWKLLDILNISKEDLYQTASDRMSRWKTEEERIKRVEFNYSL